MEETQNWSSLDAHTHAGYPSPSITALAYGVQYTPKTQHHHHRALSVDRLASLGIRYVRVTWHDLTAVTRFRVVPLAHFTRMVSSPRPSVSMVRATLGIVDIHLADGFVSTGEYLYRIELESLRVCPYAPGHVSVMGCFEEKMPIPGVDGVPTLKVDLCPRSTLKRVIEDARDTAHVEFLVGFELEFTLLSGTDPIVPVSRHAWSASEGLRTGSTAATVLEKITDALQDAGIEVQMYHPEAATSQYEVVTGPLAPLQAADAYVHTRETIFNIAAQHGLHATFAPRVFMDSPGGGLHTHISVHSTTHVSSAHTPAHRDPHATLPPSPSPNLSPREASFLSALLTSLPALALLMLPIRASYARMMDGIWSGGTYICWGTDVREAPIRLCAPHGGNGTRNFEVRTVDGVANVYAVLAGLLGVGTRGVQERARLELKDCGVLLGGEEGMQGKIVAAMDEEERGAYGIGARMPLQWEEAREAMGKSVVMREVLGKRFVDGYMSVNKLLVEKYDAPETEEDKLNLLVKNY